MTASPTVANTASDSARALNEDPRPTTAADHFAHNYLVFNKTNFNEVFDLINERDKLLHEEILKKTKSIIGALTFNIWDDIEAKELEDKINADIKIELEPPAITKATAVVSFLVDGTDLATPLLHTGRLFES